MGRSADVPRAPVQLEGDDTGCSILHVDMDAFYASVEIRRRPELRGRPVVVGGDVRGVVAAASYEARRFGIRSAMAMSQARRLCAHLVVLPPDRATYSAVSAQVMALLGEITPLVEPLSLDEAYLDVSGALRSHGSPARIARWIRAQVYERMQLTCSVGVAPTKFVAKLASARCKPDGMLVVPAPKVLEFIRPLPVTVLAGVGSRTAENLHRLGVRTVADLACTPADTLRRSVGAAVAEHLHQLAQGHDDRAVQPNDVEKSISSEHTLDVDLVHEDQVRQQLLRLSQDVGARLRERRLVARTVGIKIRFADFRTVTRVRTLTEATDATGVVYETSCELYHGLELDQPRVRLVGVKAENLQQSDRTPQQLALELAETAPHTATDRVLDQARARFGSGSIGYGSLLRNGGTGEGARNS
jgi:DNA polymerase IV